jgi:hypothetical protein
MTGKKRTRRDAVQQISVSGNAAGVAVVSGSGNTVTAIVHASNAAPPAVLQSLQEIQAALSRLPKSKAILQEAVKEAKSDDPDKPSIGAQLKTALDAAKTTLGWAELAVKLAPHIETVVGWLGVSWATQIGL